VSLVVYSILVLQSELSREEEDDSKQLNQLLALTVSSLIQRQYFLVSILDLLFL
jgi:hypothetical protein